jgi:hypothetical protein
MVTVGGVVVAVLGPPGRVPALLALVLLFFYSVESLGAYIPMGSFTLFIVQLIIK